VQLVTQYYQFQPVEAGAAERVYQVRSEAGVHSELRLAPD
jgi:hypothetical protein